MTSTDIHSPSVACTDNRHHLCDLAGYDMFLREFQPGTCPCDCHEKAVTE